MKEGPFIDRKTMRKENRKLKKQKKEIYYKKLKPLEKTQIPTPPPPTKKISKTKQNTQKNQETIALESTINLDDQMIRKYEKKLGISKNSKKEDKFQKEMMQDGLDHSFFRLLDKIHSSTNKPLENYKSYAYSDDEEDENEVSNNSAEINEEEEDASFKEEFNEVEESFSEEESILSGEERILSEEEKDFSSSVEEKEKVLIISQKVSKSKKPILKKNNIPMTHERNAILMETNKEAIQKTLKKNPPLSNKISQELKEKKAMIIEKDTSSEIVKKIQSNLNKLSEGNIENIFTQIVEIFNQQSKFVIYEVFSNIFVKSLIDNLKSLPHIMACTCVFTCALHQIYDNDFFSIIMRKVSIKFNENIDKNLENHDENESFLILKNISLIYSFFYLFDSISLDFLNGYISFLLERMNNEIIELLLTIIQNIGMKVRKDNPKILKDIIDSIKDAFERYKTANDLKIIQRGDFLLMILNDIKLNKNLKNNSFESMGFLISWIKKNVLGKLKLVPKMFTLLFAELKNADFNQNRWWIFRENNANLQDFQKPNQDDTLFISNEQKDYLERLATEQKFVTTLRKKIFMIIMNSEDYLDALQNLLKLKLNHKESKDIAVVLVECCVQEQTFNKFYFFLAEKLVEIKPDLKFSIQYALWDQYKLVENFTLRKICNLAKFSAFLIKKKVIGLGALKGLELEEKNDHIFLFMKAFLKTFFENFDKNILFEIMKKVKLNEENFPFCELLSDYIKKKIYVDLKTSLKEDDKKYCEKIKIFLGFLKISL